MDWTWTMVEGTRGLYYILDHKGYVINWGLSEARALLYVTQLYQYNWKD